MTQMADITIKNGADVNVTYNGVVPSAGDRSPARWTRNDASSVIGHRPSFQLVTRNNGNGNGRHFEATFKGPVVETGTDGVPRVVATMPLSVSATLPTNVDSAKVADLFTQAANLLSSALIREAAATGYAPS